MDQVFLLLLASSLFVVNGMRYGVRCVINNAGVGNFYDGYSASDTYYQRCNLTDKRDLKVGMIVATPKTPFHGYQNAGHIGIYIGNNQVMHNATVCGGMSFIMKRIA